MKVCKDCGESKDLGHFYKHSGYYNARCKKCHGLKTQQWFKDNPEKARNIRRRTRLKSKYGISDEKYEQMFQAQNGKCALCSKSHTRRKLNVDHCHRTGLVRGLLCDKCNLGIGLFDDNPHLLNKVKEYLETPSFRY